jgi:hypothetical protein
MQIGRFRRPGLLSRFGLIEGRVSDLSGTRDPKAVPDDDTGMAA